MSGAEVVLGVVAGGAGLMSLSIQLAESSMKLTRAYHSMRNAPEAMKDVAHEIEIMSLSLKYLERHRQFAAHGADLLDRCIKKCRKHTGEIQHLVDKIVRRIGKTALPGALYAVYKVSDLEQFLRDLGRARAALHLAVELYHWEEQDRRWLFQQARDDRHVQQVGLAQQTQHQQHYAVIQRLDLVLARLQSSGSSPIKAEASSLGAGQVPGTSNTLVNTDYLKKHRSDDPEMRRVYRTNFKLPSWFASFCSRVWDMAFFDADRGWDTCLRTYYERPYETEAFALARRGDIDGIKRLVQQGEASFLDVTPEGKSLFGVTLRGLDYMRQDEALKCIQWLLCNRVPVRKADLDRFWLLNHWISDQYRDAVLKCILDKCDSPLEFQDSYTLWYASTDVESHQALIIRFRDALEVLSKDDYINFGTSLFSCRKSAVVYLRQCMLSEVNTRLALWRGRSGESALHHVAWALNKGDIGNATGWFNLGAALIRKGADPCALYMSRDPEKSHETRPKTPLIALLEWQWSEAIPSHPNLPTTKLRYNVVGDSYTSLTDLYERLHSWNRMLKMAGVDLHRYYAAESDIRNKMCPRIPLGVLGDALDRDQLKAIVVLAQTQPLVLRLRTWLQITVRRLNHVPGNFDATKTICWQPRPVDRDEGRWTVVKVLDLLSAPHDGDTSYEPNSPVIVDLLESTQDDHGILMRMIHRSDSDHRRPLKRTTSQPPPISRRMYEHTRLQESEAHPWLPGYHLCVAHSTWTFAPHHLVHGRVKDSFDPTSCMRGQFCPTKYRFTGSFLAEMALCRSGEPSEIYRGRSGTSSLLAHHHRNPRSCPQGCGLVTRLRPPCGDSLPEWYPGYWMPNWFPRFI